MPVKTFTRLLMIQLHYFYLLLSYYNYHNWIIGVLIRFIVNRDTRRYDGIEIQNKKINTTDHTNFYLVHYSTCIIYQSITR